MLASLAAIFVGVKEALVLVNEIISDAKAVAAFIQSNKDEAWFKSSSETFKQIREAKSDEERRAAARRLRDSWRNL